MYTVDASVSAECTPATLGGTVDLRVLDDEGIDVELLVLGICLCVTEEVEDDRRALNGPSTLGGELVGLALSGENEMSEKSKEKVRTRHT